MNPETVLEHYLIAAVWAGLDYETDPDASNPLPLDENYSADDVSEETRAEILAEIVDFLAACEEAGLLENYPAGPEQFGHDFYLTRNHHGAGYWDRGLGDLGSKLTDLAHAWGSSDLFPQSDGKLYAEG